MHPENLQLGHGGGADDEARKPSERQSRGLTEAKDDALDRARETQHGLPTRLDFAVMHTSAAHSLAARLRPRVGLSVFVKQGCD